MNEIATVKITELYDSEGNKLDPKEYQYLLGNTFEVFDGDNVTNGYLEVVE